MTTLHANNCKDAIQRLIQLINEKSVGSQEELIASALNCIFYVEKVEGFGPALTQIMEVGRYVAEKKDFETRYIKKASWSEFLDKGT